MGASLGDAVRMHAVIFPDIFIRLVSVGEETGNLEGSLRDVASHLRRVEDLVSAIKRALVYPIFAFTSAMGAMIFWLVYVLPKILSLFQDMQVAIPGVTRFLILASNFTQKFWPILMLLPFIFYAMIRLLKRNSKAAYYIDLAKLKIPIMKLIVENKILGLFTEQMRILIRSGLTIDRSLELVSEIVGNAVYKNAIASAREEVLAGSTISDALKKQRLFSPLLLRMTHVGESSGTLEEQYTFMSEFYIKKLDDISERLGKMLEPIIIIVLGIMFAVIIIGLLLPVYDLISKMGKV
jgi:type II secretory pathway component PulF